MKWQLRDNTWKSGVFKLWVVGEIDDLWWVCKTGTAFFPHIFLLR